MLGEILIKVCELYKSSEEILKNVIKISEILLTSENVILSPMEAERQSLKSADRIFCQGLRKGEREDKS